MRTYIEQQANDIVGLAEKVPTRARPSAVPGEAACYKATACGVTRPGLSKWDDRQQ
jgi:hypothetical protein